MLCFTLKECERNWTHRTGGSFNACQNSGKSPKSRNLGRAGWIKSFTLLEFMVNGHVLQAVRLRNYPRGGKLEDRWLEYRFRDLGVRIKNPGWYEMEMEMIQTVTGSGSRVLFVKHAHTFLNCWHPVLILAAAKKPVGFTHILVNENSKKLV